MTSLSRSFPAFCHQHLGELRGPSLEGVVFVGGNSISQALVQVRPGLGLWDSSRSRSLHLGEL